MNYIPAPERSAIAAVFKRVLDSEEEHLHKRKDRALASAHASGTFPSDFADRILLKAYYEHYSSTCAELRAAIVEVIEKRTLEYSEGLVHELTALFDENSALLGTRLSNRIQQQGIRSLDSITPTFADYAAGASRAEADAIRIAALCLRRPSESQPACEKKEDLIDLRPNLWGFGLNLNEMLRRFRKNRHGNGANSP